MSSQKLIFTQQVAEAIDNIIASITPSPKVFVLTDTNVARDVLPTLSAASQAISSANGVITIPAGDVNKNISSAMTAWQTLTEAKASRHDVMINIGGGVVTDLGGFVASTYKRGIRFINVPTTLLGAVDAAVGGKTGINFGGYKNQVGAFSNADTVIISTSHFKTLSQSELLSGYAEMIKHAMLTGADAFAEVMSYDITDGGGNDTQLPALLEKSIKVKEGIVAADPTEKGLRKALNWGHTIGHAFESFAMSRQAPIPHGFAVAYGMVVEAILSHIKEGFPSARLHQLAQYINRHYQAPQFTCDDYPTLLTLMSQDKKNVDSAHINFTMLRDLGDPVIDCTADAKTICDALDIYRDLAGI